MLIAAAFSALLLLSLGLMLVSASKDSAQTKRRRQTGIEYCAAIRRLLASIQQHRGMASALLNGDASFRAQMLAKQSEIEQHARALDALHRRSAELEYCAAEWHSAKAAWNDTQARVLSLSAGESFERHSALIAKLLHMLNDVGDRSRLLLDHRASARRLADALLRRLPLMAEYSGQARAIGVGVAAEGRCTAVARIRLVFLSKRLRAALVTVSEAMAEAHAADAALSGTLAPRLEACRCAVLEFIDLINSRIIEAETIDLPPNAYFAAATRAIDGSFALFDEIAASLGRSLDSGLERAERCGQPYAFAAIALLLVMPLLPVL